jgi:hypothetical protein
MGYQTRKPTSNDAPPQDSNPYGADEYYDDFALLINELARRCAGCKRVIRNRYLADGKCPDCRKD